jgi:hypothetical protein
MRKTDAVAQAPRGEYLDRALVAPRAVQFPALAELAGTRLERVLSGHPVKRAHASGLLRWFEQTGDSSHNLLTELGSAVNTWDRVNPPGWAEMRRSLGPADHRKAYSLCAELVVAGWALTCGIEVAAMEPENGSHRADLRLVDGSASLTIEVTTPWPAKSDWIAATNARMMEHLERVPSGLRVEVSGYSSMTRADGGRFMPPATLRDVDAVVVMFARNAAAADRLQFPTILVSAAEGQPVQVTAVGIGEKGRTIVETGWNRNGLVPDVGRLVETVLRERKHLDLREAACVLVDLTAWREFSPGDYYFEQARIELARHGRMPSMVGTFLWRSEGFAPYALGILHEDSAWARSPIAAGLMTRL